MTHEYEDYEYKTIDAENGESGRRLAGKIVSLVQTCPQVRDVVDLGCGNGYIANKLALSGYQVTGIDASRTGIELARQNYSADNLKFICARVDLSLPAILPDRKFDLVLSSDVIEHLYRPADMLEVAARLLKTEGHVIIGTPYHGFLKNLALSIANKWDDHHTVVWDGGHIKFFSVRTLRTLMCRCGYSDIVFSFYGRAPWLWKNMICLARKKT